LLQIPSTAEIAAQQARWFGFDILDRSLLQSNEHSQTLL
jgi:hypothetical protein